MARRRLPAFYPASLSIAQRSSARDVPEPAAPPQAAAPVPATPKAPPSPPAPLLAAGRPYRRHLLLARGAAMYMLMATVILSVGYAGAYVVASQSTGVALAITLGVILPAWTVVACCARRVDTDASTLFFVTGAAVAVITVASGKIWEPAYTLIALDRYDVPVDAQASLPVQADGAVFSFADGAAGLQRQCTPHSTSKEPWCAAPITVGQDSVAHFVAVAHDCCEKGRITCRGWDERLPTLTAVQVELAAPPDSEDIDSAVRRALATCNSMAAPRGQRVLLFDDMDAYIKEKLVWGWVVAILVALCWLPVGFAILWAATHCTWW